LKVLKVLDLYHILTSVVDININEMEKFTCLFNLIIFLLGKIDIVNRSFDCLFIIFLHILRS